MLVKSCASSWIHRAAHQQLCLSGYQQSRSIGGMAIEEDLLKAEVRNHFPSISKAQQAMT